MKRTAPPPGWLTADCTSGKQPSFSAAKQRALAVAFSAIAESLDHLALDDSARPPLIEAICALSVCGTTLEKELGSGYNRILSKFWGEVIHEKSIL